MKSCRLDPPSPSCSDQSIGISDLVVDLGNSRYCGTLEDRYTLTLRFGSTERELEDLGVVKPLQKWLCHGDLM